MIRKKTEGIFGNRWVKKMLGQVSSELDRVLEGLVLKPKRKRYRAGLRTLGFALGSDTGLGLLSDSRLDLPPKPGSESSSNPVSALPHASDLCLVLSPISEVSTTTGIEQVLVVEISVFSHYFPLLPSGPDSFLLDVVAAHSSEALALGGRLCSLSGLSENGTPTVLNKQMLRYFWRAKKEQGSRVKDSLLLEAVESLSAPLVQYQSNPVAGFAAQVKFVPKNTNPMRGILWRGFVNPSLMEKGDSHLSSSLVVKDDEVEEALVSHSAILNDAFRFGWDQEDEVWDGEGRARQLCCNGSCGF